MSGRSRLQALAERPLRHPRAIALAQPKQFLWELVNFRERLRETGPLQSITLERTP